MLPLRTDTPYFKWPRYPTDALRARDDLVRIVKGGSEVFHGKREPYTCSLEDWPAYWAALKAEAPVEAQLFEDIWKGIDWDLHGKAFTDCPVFWWQGEPVALVEAASPSYPLQADAATTAMGRAEWPNWAPAHPRGIHIFASPADVPRCFTVVGHQTPMMLHYFLQGDLDHDATVGIQLVVLGYRWVEGGGVSPVMRLMYPFHHGEPFAQAIVKWLNTAEMFMSQEILLAGSVPAERHYRRHIGGPTASVRVVSLRRTSHADRSPTSGEQALREWACRWVVSGHWRRQYYASCGKHRPLWIHPYIKGPEDKPFVPPRPAVVAVRR